MNRPDNELEQPAENPIQPHSFVPSAAKAGRQSPAGNLHPALCALMMVAALSLTACGEDGSAGKSKAAQPANEFQVTVNGEPADYTGMAMGNTYRDSSLQLWNVQKAPVIDATEAEADTEKAVTDMLGSVLDGNQLKITLVGVDLPNHKLPYRIAGDDEGVNAMSTPRATLQLTHDKKNYLGGAAMIPDVPTDWQLTIERIDGEMVHGSFQGTVVNMYDSKDRITMTDGRFILKVKGIAGE